MEQKIENFIEYLQDEKGASENTRISYARDLRKLRAYLREQKIEAIEDVSETSLNSYVLQLEREGKAAATVSRNIASAKCFFEYYFKRGTIREDPAERIKAPRVEKKYPQILSVSETEKLMEQPKSDCPKGLRDRAMLELLYASGIRVSELISLKLDDLNLPMEYIVCHEKSKDRAIPFGRVAGEAIKKYLEQGREALMKQENNDYLFVNCSGKQMSRQGFWKLIKFYAGKAGIEKEITPHTLRHSFAAHLIENGADIKAVQEMMGHVDIASTQIYAQMKTNSLREVYKKAHPRG